MPADSPSPLAAATHALRALRRRPTFTLLTLGLLTLATAAVAAIFAVVNATLLRPLPYRDPDALHWIATTEPTGDSLEEVVAAPIQIARWRAETRTLTSVEGWTPVTLDLSGDGDPEALRGFAISAGLFDLLGTPPVAGRSFRMDEETPTSGVAIVSHTVAERRFGGAARAIGKRITLDGQPRSIVGVMPAHYSMLFQGGDVWIPLDLTLQQQTTKARLRVIAAYGRLRPGATRAAALADLERIQRGIRDEQIDAFRFTGMRITPLRENLFGAQRAGMLLLTGALALIIVIAGANVGNLMLADVAARRIMTLTRLALGASRGSLVVARLLEALVLVAIALPVGLLLAAGTLAVLSSIDATPFTALGGQWLDWRVFTVTTTATLIVALGAALPAAMVESRVELGTIANAASKGAGSRIDRRARHALAALQVAITVVLLTGAAMLGRHVTRLLGQSPGFDAHGLLAVMLNVSATQHTTSPDRAQYVDALVQAVKHVPGVEGASTIQTRFILNEAMQTAVDVQGHEPPPGVQEFTQIRHVMPDVFRVMRIRVVAGRGLDSTDRAGSPPVAVVNRSFAKQYWPGESAVGKRLRRHGPANAPWLEVVGVVDDITDAGAGVALGPALYLPYLQQNTATTRVTIVVRSRGSAASIARDVRRALWTVNRAQAVDEVTPLETLLSRSASQPRFQALVIGTFGASALALVLAGIYALTLLTTFARMRELGVRAALGAAPRHIVAVAMGGSMLPVIAGVIVGAGLAVPAAHVVAKSINGALETSDVMLLGCVGMLLLVATAAAAFVPARRASRVAPSAALRA
jgi:predicted permease